MICNSYVGDRFCWKEGKLRGFDVKDFLQILRCYHLDKENQCLNHVESNTEEEIHTSYMGILLATNAVRAFFLALRRAMLRQ